jgi:hypothetical protein
MRVNAQTLSQLAETRIHAVVAEQHAKAGEPTLLGTTGLANQRNVESHLGPSEFTSLLSVSLRRTS